MQVLPLKRERGSFTREYRVACLVATVPMKDVVPSDLRV
jgi:hypothetical protein